MTANVPPNLPLFTAPYAADDVELARQLFADVGRLTPEREARIDAEASDLIAAIRSDGPGLGGIEDVLREYALSTKEGLALMTLAEALLRVPDAATADRFIEDRLGSGDFAHHIARSDAFLVTASSWALGVTARLIQPRETPETTLAQLAKRLGAPAVRAAARQAMRVMGNHFVLGQTIESAIDRAQSGSGRSYRYSFDMLGEGARTAEDARRYFQSYSEAIETIGRRASEKALPERPGVSVKLSALHPRYEALSHARVMSELVPLTIELARQAKRLDLVFTIDAEEADRLELSLDVFAAVLADPLLAGWSGFGLAVQAYQKRAGAVIDYVADLAQRFDRRLMVRLVKGAYWDTEVKRAQERGLDDFPVFTRKAMTDLNYLACAQKLLSLRPCLYPQFATHNALTVATILERAGDTGGFEFQRLHGMGEALYARLLERRPAVACRTYAPVGGHRDLLAYLVRRLLENGANSSFVSRAADPAVPVEALLKRPADTIGDPAHARHPRLALPRDLYSPDRVNSRGVEFGDRAGLAALLTEIDRGPAVLLPNGSVEAAKAGLVGWDRTPADERGRIFERAAGLLEARRGRFIGLLQGEGGKTLDDAVSEVREAIDYCRYYAVQGRALFGEGVLLPGPTGESNLLRLRGRGVFVAISPWNFPLAIFLGQVVGALAAGNSVVAKPAEQTPLVAAEAVRLLHEAGVPPAALQFVAGNGLVGAELVRHPDIAGVVFTGSTEVARHINRALAAKDGPIAVLIAETGGINAMIVDATALPEQVCDDVITSAFRSAGQRCSALRILHVQEDVADRMIDMIVGATRELKLGDPADPSVQIGPVIDAEAKGKLEAYLARATGRVHYAGETPTIGTFVAPHILELADPAELKEEVFGPVLHVVRYPADGLGRVLAAIEASGYRLTLGIHSRIDDVVEKITCRLSVGNIYVNRNIIGAVVGVQPFGGHGLSGTGPKAGGPHYLLRFAVEQTVTINTAAVGGNAALMTASEGG
jgi:RHH-type proline utilization regulon transcriptional repressor/proline dehydrogenase/delta 1-pyrroline-5-carboxylate dehydrogenase